MEGRAIARPNVSVQGAMTVERGMLQWRAGQLPGQTRPCRSLAGNGRAGFNGGPGNCPAKPLFVTLKKTNCVASMEGRAIARPNLRSQRTALQCVAGFNGGPGNCPAKLQVPGVADSTSQVLQWRAGQLPGQTCRRRRTSRTGSRCFNGGPGNCPAKPPRVWNQRLISDLSFNGGPGNCPAKLLVRFGGSDLPVCGRLRAVL